jgi:hypothetical protein
MLKVLACMVIALCAAGPNAPRDDRAVELLRSLVQNKESVLTYSCRYNGKRTFLVNSDEWTKNPQCEFKYQMYDYTLADYYDNGKRAFEVQRPMVVQDRGIIEGKTDYVRQVYDGQRVILNERPNHYLISRTPERYGGLPTPMKSRDGALSWAADELDKGKASLTLESEGAYGLLNVKAPGGENSPDIVTVTFKVNMEQGNRIEEMTSAFARVVLSDFRDVGGGLFVPMYGEILRTVGERVLDKDEMQLEEVHINEPIDPSLFQMQIPIGAKVFHEDLGMVLDLQNTQQLDKIEETLLAQAEEAAHDVGNVPAVGKTPTDGKTAEKQPLDQAPDKSRRLWFIGAAVLLAVGIPVTIVIRNARRRKTSVS